MEVYDSHIAESGTLAFSYCDVVADFYAAVFRTTLDPTVKRLVMERLLDLGFSHNRFYVHTAVVDLISSLYKAPDVAVTEEAILQYPEPASWYAEEALKNRLSQPIAKAFQISLEKRSRLSQR